MSADMVKLIERDGPICHYCGAKLGDTALDRQQLPRLVPRGIARAGGPPFEAWPQVEHLTPVCRGGTERLSNKVLACGWCNSHKGSRTHDEFPHLCELAA